MTGTTDPTTLDGCIQAVLVETAHANNSYFTNLMNGEFSKEDFVATQIQFYYAVCFFSRPMAALAAKIPLPELRLEILRNVWEEHGMGELRHGHSNTFLEFLSRLAGVTADDVNRTSLWPEVRIFNTALAGLCVLDDVWIGVAALGIIERMFSDISAWIGRGVVRRRWIVAEEMIHYQLHEKLDLKHSDDFFALLRPRFIRDETARYRIEQGLRLGATLFNDLYEGLWRARTRRWTARPAGESDIADKIELDGLS